MWGRGEKVSSGGIEGNRQGVTERMEERREGRGGEGGGGERGEKDRRRWGNGEGEGERGRGVRGGKGRGWRGEISKRLIFLCDNTQYPLPFLDTQI